MSATIEKRVLLTLRLLDTLGHIVEIEIDHEGDIEWSISRARSLFGRAFVGYTEEAIEKE